MQALKNAAAYPRCGYYVERPILGFDDRCSDNAHVPIHVCTAVFAIVDIRGRSKVDVPERFRSIRSVGIEGIHAIIHRGHVYQIMCAAAQFHIGHDQWVAVNLIVNHSAKQHPKVPGVYVGWSEDDLIQVGPGALAVVMLREHTYLAADGRAGTARYKRGGQ